MKQGFDWGLIRSFLAALDCGSLLGAAKVLGTSQPTIGRHIAELESQLGVVLFERTGRGLLPAETALRLADSARAMEDGALQLARKVSVAQTRVTGTVRLTTSQSVACYLLPPLLAQMRQALPDIQVELVVSNAVSNLLRVAVKGAQRLRLSTVAGDLIAWKYLAPEREEKLVKMRTPLFGVDGDGGSEPFKKAMVDEMRNAELRRGDFIANEVPGMIWKEEQRDALVKPANVTDVRIEPDEMHEGNVKASLQFELPRGAYATMLVKRLFAPSWYSRPLDRSEPREPRGPGTANLKPRSIVRYDDYDDD